jgi:hypothetical protein
MGICEFVAERFAAFAGLFAFHRAIVPSLGKTFAPEFQGLLDRGGTLFAVVHRYSSCMIVSLNCVH